jgi:hypothetical protein
MRGQDIALWIHTHAALFLLIVLWSLFWKGMGLWHSGKRGQPLWFVLILLINTLGILEIIYLFGFLKLTSSDLFR